MRAVKFLNKLTESTTTIVYTELSGVTISPVAIGNVPRCLSAFVNTLIFIGFVIICTAPVFYKRIVKGRRINGRDSVI